MSFYEKRLEIECEIAAHDMRQRQNRFNENQRNFSEDDCKTIETHDVAAEKVLSQRRREKRKHKFITPDMVIALLFYAISFLLCYLKAMNRLF